MASLCQNIIFLNGDIVGYLHFRNATSLKEVVLLPDIYMCMQISLDHSLSSVITVFNTISGQGQGGQDGQDGQGGLECPDGQGGRWEEERRLQLSFMWRRQLARLVRPTVSGWSALPT